MPLKESDIVEIDITNQMRIAAEYFANKRILFEYPRKGYGSYNQRHINYIITSYLGEFALLEYLHSHLLKKYDKENPEQRWRILHKEIGFSYMIVVGRFDVGFEFQLGKNKQLTIDVKTYHRYKVTKDKIIRIPLNLFVDADQHSHADIYVQAFLSENNEVLLAGYNEGLPPYADWMPNPAHARPVPDLQPMVSLTRYMLV